MFVEHQTFMNKLKIEPTPCMLVECEVSIIKNYLFSVFVVFVWHWIIAVKWTKSTILNPVAFKRYTLRRYSLLVLHSHILSTHSFQYSLCPHGAFRLVVETYINQIITEINIKELLHLEWEFVEKWKYIICMWPGEGRQSFPPAFTSI